MMLIEAREAQARLERLIEGRDPNPDLTGALTQIHEHFKWALDVIEFPFDFDDQGNRAQLNENNAPNEELEEEEEEADLD